MEDVNLEQCVEKTTLRKELPYLINNNNERALLSFIKVNEIQVKINHNKIYQSTKIQQEICKKDNLESKAQKGYYSKVQLYKRFLKNVLRQQTEKGSAMEIEKHNDVPWIDSACQSPQWANKDLQISKLFRNKEYSVDVQAERNRYLRPQIYKLPKLQFQQPDLLQCPFKIKESFSQENLKDFVMETKSFVLQDRIIQINKSIQCSDRIRNVNQSCDRLDEQKKPLIPTHQKYYSEYIFTLRDKTDAQITLKPLKRRKDIQSRLNQEILLDLERDYGPKKDQQYILKTLFQRNHFINQSINLWYKHGITEIKKNT